MNLILRCLCPYDEELRIPSRVWRNGGLSHDAAVEEGTGRSLDDDVHVYLNGQIA